MPNAHGSFTKLHGYDVPFSVFFSQFSFSEYVLGLLMCNFLPVFILYSILRYNLSGIIPNALQIMFLVLLEKSEYLIFLIPSRNFSFLICHKTYSNKHTKVRQQRFFHHKDEKDHNGFSAFCLTYHG